MISGANLRLSHAVSKCFVTHAVSKCFVTTGNLNLKEAGDSSRWRSLHLNALAVDWEGCKNKMELWKRPLSGASWTCVTIKLKMIQFAAVGEAYIGEISYKLTTNYCYDNS